MQITYFKELYKTDTGHIRDVSRAIERIKSGTSKSKIEALRSAKTEEESDLIKRSLPCILFAGVFSERSDDGLVNHSGLCVLDFDDIPEDQMQSMRDTICSNSHVFLCFTSPSGNGLKAVILIPPCNKYDHIRYYKAFHEEFPYDYWDAKNSNVSRICFESYDPEIYVNKEAKVFDKLTDDQDNSFAIKDKPPVLELDDHAEIIRRLMLWWNRKYGFVKDNRNNNTYVLAASFCSFGIPKELAISYITNNVVQISKDFTQQECLNIIESAYRRTDFHSRYFEDDDKKKAIQRDLKNGTEYVLDRHKIDKNTLKDIQQVLEAETFWTLKENKKSQTVSITIDPYRYKNFLERNGFKKYFADGSQRPTFVRIDSNRVSETSPERIKDFVMRYLEEKKEFHVWNRMANYQREFSENYLLMLDTIDMTMLKDTKDKSFLAYSNGIVMVNKNSIEFIDYIDIDAYVWKDQIIDRDYTSVSSFDNDFKTFVNNISNGNSEPFECAIGYLINTYKNKVNNRAVILNDEVISENPEGGTGKGLFVQGIRQIRKTAILDGKNFDDHKSFPYQTVSQDTQILVFDDVQKNFNFENKFSIITEGITLERKNKDAIKLPVESSPKVIITTNYAIKGGGNSHDRRRFELEFAQYYNKERTPVDEFNRQLFDDWSQEEFNRFDQYMIKCVQKYLRMGLTDQSAKNVKKRKLIAETSFEFVEWMEDTDNYNVNTPMNKKEWFNKFVEEYNDFKRWLTQKRFTQWMEKYGEFMDYTVVSGNTNGTRWIEFNTKDVDVLEIEQTPF